jgi:hypothetical protein
MLKTVGNPSTRYGDQTIVDGNLVIGTSGKGIDFSAYAHAAGMTSELLDDYEEGTWTVTWTSLTSGTPSNTTGTYTKIGRAVYFTYAAGSNSLQGTRDVTRFSLPFAPALYSAGVMVSQTVLNSGSVLIDPGSVAYPESFNGAFMVFSGFYFVAS